MILRSRNSWHLKELDYFDAIVVDMICRYANDPCKVLIYAISTKRPIKLYTYHSSATGQV